MLLFLVYIPPLVVVVCATDLLFCSMKKWILFATLSAIVTGGTVSAHNRADTLRGSNGRGRSWWDVRRYHLSTRFDLTGKGISGYNQVFFKITDNATDSMQIDLQQPMVLDSAFLITSIYSSRLQKVGVVRDGNVWWLKCPKGLMKKDSTYSIMLWYHGSPRAAVNPPWDGGFSWRTDSAGKPWVAVSCQGLGASVWWPCKDAQWEEPEEGMRVSLSVPDTLMAVSNGRLESSTHYDGYATYVWEVQNSINSYDATFYIGDYVQWTDTLKGEKGKLDLSYYVLRANEQKARKQFEVVKPMLRCFEYWMGPYPFYEDGYKLVEAPYLGMEHQSAVAYGNNYQMGYKGIDRSLTGWGLKWDYIIIHESGHEWFGNSITAADMADNWIHEGFTSYTEVLFTECLLGKEKATKYSRGLWHNIDNKGPVIGPYGVNDEGEGDIYEKGAAVIHMIRKMMNNDEKFRQMLRAMNKEFYHSIVTSDRIEDYIERFSGIALKPFFEQYLRRTDIPHIEYNIADGVMNYRFTNVVPGFQLPVTVVVGESKQTINITGEWQKTKWTAGYNVRFAEDFLVKAKS